MIANAFKSCNRKPSECGEASSVNSKCCNVGAHPLNPPFTIMTGEDQKRNHPLIYSLALVGGSKYRTNPYYRSVLLATTLRATT